MEQSEFRYEAQYGYKDPPSSIQENDREAWKSKDKVRRLLGFFSAKSFQDDWKAALPDTEERKNADWKEFIDLISKYYEPTENKTLRNFEFRQLTQNENEAFAAWIMRVEEEGKTCYFKCTSNTCTTMDTAIRDQVIIGTTDSEIRK